MDILSIYSLGYCLFGQLWRINLQTEKKNNASQKTKKQNKTKDIKIVSNKSRKDLRIQSKENRRFVVLCCATAGLNSSRTSTWDQKSCCFASGRYYMYTSYVPLSDKYTWTHCQAQHLASNIYKYERKLTKSSLGSFHADMHTIKESRGGKKKEQLLPN